MFKSLFKSRTKEVASPKPKLKARYYGTRGEQIRGAVYCPEDPEAVFHVEWIEETNDGEYRVLDTALADSTELHCGAIPPGHGFHFSTAEKWSDGLIHRVILRVKETGRVFPEEKKFYDPDKVGSYVGEIKTATFQGVLNMLANPIRKSYFRAHIIVVTHDISRTGAPMIALNLIRFLTSQGGQTVTCISLVSNGDMLADFAATGANILQPKNNTTSVVHNFLDDLGDFFNEAEKIHPTVAILNSLCAQPVAHALKRANIPTLWLFHEFPYMFSRVMIASAIGAADRLIFPCKLIKESYKTYFEQREASESVRQRIDQASIIPQGVWWAHPEKNAMSPESEKSTDREKTRELWNVKPDDFVVICVGTADVRKGADWLIHFAQIFCTKYPEAPVKFLWIGEFPENEYANHMALDIECIGLKERVHFTGSTEDMDSVYDSADLMLMCSRLDPFPNVVLEAMRHSLPVLGFDNGQGTSDFIRDAEAGTVVPYMNCEATADAIIQYINSPEKCARDGKNGKEAVTATLSHEDFGKSILKTMIDTAGISNPASQMINSIALKSTDLLPPPYTGSPTDDEKNLVLVRGQMKSGTNWICNVLNHHPEVCIRGEYHFKPSVWNAGGINDRELTARFIAAMRAASDLPGVRWYGDRTPSAVPDPLFPDAKVIYIHRDPRDLLISNAFHHLNNAIARSASLPKLTCPNWLDLIKRHHNDPKLIESQPHLLLESSEIVDYLIALKEVSLPSTVAYLKDNNLPNILVVRYETLHQEFDAQVERIFSFLGLKTDTLFPFEPKIKPGFEGKVNNQDFFRKGQPGDWRNYLHQEEARKLWDRLSDVMKWGGYEEDDQWIDALPKRNS